MTMWVVQWVSDMVWRHLLCWHVWRRLPHHGCPGEPHLDECVVCGWITTRPLG